MIKGIIKILKLILILFATFLFVVNNFSLEVFNAFFFSLICLFFIQFFYGLLFYRFEKLNERRLLFFIFLIYILLLFFIKHESIINFVNIISILFTTYISYKYLKEKKNMHSGVLFVLLSLIVHLQAYYMFGDNILLLLVFIPTSLVYFVQNLFFNKKKKTNNILKILYCLVLILFFVFFINNYNSPNYYENTFFNYILIMGIIVSLRGFFYFYSISFTKIELFVYVFLIIFYVFNLNVIYLSGIIPLIMMYVVFSLDEKYELINIKKFFVSKKIEKVSAVIPNYNYSRYIESRIDSVLKQNYPIYELIVLDDNSSDDSDTVIKNKLKAVKREYPKLKIKYIKNKKNSGNVFKQWEKAFNESSGDYLWICEADDLCSKYLLNSVMYGFCDKDVVLSYCESLAIDENGKIFMEDMRIWNDVSCCGRWNASYILDGKEALSKYLCINNSINNASSVVFKKDKSIPVNKYLDGAQTFRLAGDWYFYAKILLHGKIAYCADSLNYHRLHNNSVTNTTKSSKVYEEIVSVQKTIADDVSVDDSTKLIIDKYNNSLKN